MLTPPALQGTDLSSLAEEGTGLSSASSGNGGAASPVAAGGPCDGGVHAPQCRRRLWRSTSFRRALGPTIVLVYALLVLKTAQQGFLDAFPLLTVRAGLCLNHSARTSCGTERT